MKTQAHTRNGYRISRNGVVNTSLEAHAILSTVSKGAMIKRNGTYYFISRKQGSTYVYLP